MLDVKDLHFFAFMEMLRLTSLRVHTFPTSRHPSIIPNNSGGTPSRSVPDMTVLRGVEDKLALRI
jgi:hypothetical protein